jgi:hypothetical protein
MTMAKEKDGRMKSEMEAKEDEERLIMHKHR